MKAYRKQGPSVQRRGRRVGQFNTAGGVRFAKLVHHPGLPSRKPIPCLRLGETLAVRGWPLFAPTATEPSARLVGGC